MPIANAIDPAGPVPPEMLHPCSMNVTDSWGVVKMGGVGPQAFNYQAQITVTSRSTWVCGWTQGGTESAGNQRVVVARSTDGGRTWSGEIEIEPAGEGYRVPAWIILFTVPATGRVYCFYWWNFKGTPLRDAGDIFLRYSDDDALTWSERRRVRVPRTCMDDPEGEIHGWNFGQPRLLAATGQVLFTYVKIRRSSLFPPGHSLDAAGAWQRQEAAPETPLERLVQGGSANNWETEVLFCDVSDVLTQEHPEKLSFRSLPEGDEGLWVAYPGTDRHFGQEGTLVSLSGGRLLCVFRTRRGHPFYSISTDGARTWAEPQVLRCSPGGETLCQPCAPCPIHKLRDGRFVLLFHNVQANGQGWYPRDPMWVAVAREAPGVSDNAGLYFASPKVILYNDRVPGGPFNDTEICYPQLYEIGGEHFVVYANKTSEIRINKVPPQLLDDHGLPM